MKLSSHSIPRGYVCEFTPHAPTMDGTLNDPVWSKAEWTSEFADIQGDDFTKPRFKTRAKMLWDQNCLYIAAQMEEPNVWATLTEHDSVIFHDNDFEVFMDPNNTGAPYMELEVNALNTTWDLLLPHPYRGGGPALTGWDIKGLKTAVHVDGALNDASAKCKGWTIEIAIPWTGISEICRVACPPKSGDQWRINFSRVEWHSRVEGNKYVKIPNRPEDNWVWSPMGVIDMHRPERWGVIQFASEGQNDELKPLEGWEARNDLVKAWEAEQTYRKEHGQWADEPSQLGVTIPGLQIHAGDDMLELHIGDWYVDQSLRFWKQK